MFSLNHCSHYYGHENEWMNDLGLSAIYEFERNANKNFGEQVNDKLFFNECKCLLNHTHIHFNLDSARFFLKQ